MSGTEASSSTTTPGTTTAPRRRRRRPAVPWTAKARERARMVAVLVVWPIVLGLLGLPTGAAEQALALYVGEVYCRSTVCPPCPVDAPP